MNRKRLVVSTSGVLTMVCMVISAGCGGGGGGTPCSAKNAPNVGGQWELSAVSADYVNSTCPSSLIDAAAGSVIGASEIVQVQQNGSSVRISEPEGGAVFNGCVDDTGAVSADWNTSESQNGCNVSFKVQLTGDLSQATTTVTTVYNVTSSGNCSLVTTCTVVVDGTFARLSSTAATLETQQGEMLLDSVAHGIVQRLD